MIVCVLILSTYIYVYLDNYPFTKGATTIGVMVVASTYKHHKTNIYMYRQNNTRYKYIIQVNVIQTVKIHSALVYIQKVKSYFTLKQSVMNKVRSYRVNLTGSQ